MRGAKEGYFLEVNGTSEDEVLCHKSRREQRSEESRVSHKGFQDEELGLRLKSGLRGEVALSRVLNTWRPESQRP